MGMLRAQEDINIFSTPTLLSESDGTCSYIRGVELCVGFGADKHEDMLYFLSGVM